MTITIEYTNLLGTLVFYVLKRLIHPLISIQSYRHESGKK